MVSEKRKKSTEKYLKKNRKRIGEYHHQFLNVSSLRAEYWVGKLNKYYVIKRRR